MSLIKTSAFKQIAHFIISSTTLLTLSFDVAYSQQPAPRPLSLTRIRRLEIDAGSARLTVAEAGPGRFDYQLQDGRPEAPLYATGHCLRGDREFTCTLNEQDGWGASLRIQDLDASLDFDLEIGEAAASFRVPKSSLSSYQSAETPRGAEPPPDLSSYKVLLHDFAPHLPSVAALEDVLAHIDLDSPELRLLSTLCQILSPRAPTPSLSKSPL